MDERRLIAINAGLGFFLAAALSLLLGNGAEIAILYGVVAAVVFAAAIWLLGRFEDRQRS